MSLNLETVKQLTKRLEEAGVPYASGGSGLLYSLGLADEVHDWDLTTDAPYEEIAGALQGLPWSLSPSGDHPFASSYRIAVADESFPIDIIGQFAIYSAAGICRLPAVSSALWEGIRMASPEVWAAAYTLMGRTAKAEKLLAYLQRHGADRALLHRLLDEPLPDDLRLRFTGLLR